MKKLLIHDYTLIVLALIAIWAIVKNAFAMHIIWYLAILVLITIAIEYLCKILLKKRISRKSSIITALIIFLLVNYPLLGQMWEYYAGSLALIIALLYKKFTKVTINPAVLGLIIVYILSQFVNLDFLLSWWGTNYVFLFDTFSLPLALILIALWGAFVSWKLRKHWLVITTLLTIIVLWFFLVDRSYLMFLLSDATLYFMLVFMLLEPKTSPVKLTEQIWLWILSWVVFVWSIYFHLSYLDPLVASVLAMNIAFWGYKYFKRLVAKSK